MKYPYSVKYKGKIYKPNEEIPEEKPKVVKEEATAKKSK